MSQNRSLPNRRSQNGESNGHRTRRNNRVWAPAADIESERLQTRIAELEVQARRLEDERKNFEWLFQTVPVAFVVLDENFLTTEPNPQLAKMLGIRRSLGKINFASLVVKQDVSAFLQHLRSSKLASVPLRTQIRLRDGSPGGLPVELVTLASVADADGGHASYRTAIIDLTERLVTEDRLTETLQSFSTLLDTVEGIVWEADGATMDVTFVSRYAEKMLGYPIAHWLKPGFWERHIYVDDRESVMHKVTRAIVEKRALSLDYRVLTNDRQLMWIHDRIGITSRNGKVKLLGIAVDMTEQKNFEAELEKERSSLESRVSERTAQLQTTITELEAFSYSLSHDMRAPLRAMEGYTQLLRNVLADKLGPKEIDFFGRIMASAERLDNLIQDVLQYSRVARMPLELKEIDLEKIVNQVISDYPNLQPPGADIRMQKPLMRAMGHEAFLTQCISNLLSNAVKFVAPGVKPKVTVYTRPYGGGEMRLFIEDNGIGIAADNQQQIFGIFQRLHAPTTYPGTGIGLAIVQKAIQRMGGQVGVESTLGKGSTFWLQLKRGGGVE